MNKEEIRELSKLKSVEEIIEYSKKIDEKLTKEEATNIFNFFKDHKNLKDDDLEKISAGSSWSLEANISNEPPKYSVGQKVFYQYASDEKGYAWGNIISIAADKSSGGLFPEWQYKVTYKDKGNTLTFKESELSANNLWD